MRLIILTLVVCIGLSSYNESLARTFSQLTLASYCKLQDLRAWNCAPCERNKDIKNIKVWKNSTNDTVGYIATKENQDALCTLPWDFHNWLQDINFLKTKYALCDNDCQVHRGFYQAYKDVEQQLQKIIQQNPYLVILSLFSITGHSLGAALAIHCAAHLMSLNFTVSELYTLGGPRIGDNKFKEWFNRKYGDRFKARINHYQDPVPHLPYEMWGFRHTNTEIFYDKNFEFYKVCDAGGEDYSCSNQFVVFNNKDHLNYFGYDYWSEGIACFWK